MTTMNESHELTLSVERVINTTKQALYEAWLNPKTFAKFMIPGEGMTTKDAQITPTVGSGFSLIMIAGDDEMLHKGEYLELSPFDRIQFSWVTPFSQDGSTVTVSLEDAPNGTKITLDHVKFVNEESRDNHKNGWAHILKALEQSFLVS